MGGFEVIFVSSDRDEAAFEEYFAEQPWLALDYSNRKEKEQLSNLFGIRGIPSFVIVDKDWSIITKEGREAVSADPEGNDFPWYPKPVKDLSAGPGLLNEAPCVVALCEEADAAAKQAAEAAMESLATTYIDKAKAAGEEDPKISFMIAKEAGDIAGQLRKMMGLPSTQLAMHPPKLMLVNIPDDGAYFEGPEGEVTCKTVEDIVAQFEAGSLERKQLKK